jgi:hypothetical protein
VEGCCFHCSEHSGSIKCWEILESLRNWRLLKKYSAPCSKVVTEAGNLLQERNLTMNRKLILGQENKSTKVMASFAATGRLMEMYRRSAVQVPSEFNSSSYRLNVCLTLREYQHKLHRFLKNSSPYTDNEAWLRGRAIYVQFDFYHGKHKVPEAMT